MCDIGQFCCLNNVVSSSPKLMQGLCLGSPLSPYLFLLVEQGLSRDLISTNKDGYIQGIKAVELEYITHLLFVDGILLFYHGILREDKMFNDIFQLCGKVIVRILRMCLTYNNAFTPSCKSIARIY